MGTGVSVLTGSTVGLMVSLSLLHFSEEVLEFHEGSLSSLEPLLIILKKLLHSHKQHEIWREGVNMPTLNVWK